MKLIFKLLLLSILLNSCAEKKDDTTTQVDNIKYETWMALSPLEGNWEMIGFYNYEDNKIKDSFKTNNGHRQVKMYNRNKVMWSKLVPTDSIEWFGYGSYEATDSTLTEIMQYGSSVMNQVITEQKEFGYKLIVTDSTFSQIQTDENGDMVYSENYRRIN